jgi:hypothetical protein
MTQQSPPILRSGWITKEGGRYKTWKRRWMALEGDILAYYKKEVSFTIF